MPKDDDDYGARRHGGSESSHNDSKRSTRRRSYSRGKGSRRRSKDDRHRKRHRRDSSSSSYSRSSSRGSRRSRSYSGDDASPNNRHASDRKGRKQEKREEFTQRNTQQNWGYNNQQPYEQYQPHNVYQTTRYPAGQQTTYTNQQQAYYPQNPTAPYQPYSNTGYYQQHIGYSGSDYSNIQQPPANTMWQDNSGIVYPDTSVPPPPITTSLLQGSGLQTVNVTPLQPVVKPVSQKETNKKGGTEAEILEQRRTLELQRSEYVKKSETLNRELVLLNEQKKKLINENDPNNEQELKENTKLQNEIGQKLKAVHNVIEMLSGIIGDNKKEKHDLKIPETERSKQLKDGGKSRDRRERRKSSSSDSSDVSIVEKEKSRSPRKHSEDRESRHYNTKWIDDTQKRPPRTPSASPPPSPPQVTSAPPTPPPPPLLEVPPPPPVLEVPPPPPAPSITIRQQSDSANFKKFLIQPPSPPSPPNKSSLYQSVNLVHYDPELHWCKECNIFPKSALDYLSHLHSQQHKLAIKDIRIEDLPWHDDYPREPTPPFDKSASVKRIPIRGLQFLIPATAWYCRLCKEWLGDLHCATSHLKAKTHSRNYTDYLSQNPHWEVDWLSERTRSFERNNRFREFDERQNSEQIVTKNTANVDSEISSLQDKLLAVLTQTRTRSGDSSSTSTSSSSSSSTDSENKKSKKSKKKKKKDKKKSKKRKEKEEDSEIKKYSKSPVQKEEPEKVDFQNETQTQVTDVNDFMMPEYGIRVNPLPKKEEKKNEDDKIIKEWMGNENRTNGEDIANNLKGKVKQKYESDKRERSDYSSRRDYSRRDYSRRSDVRSRRESRDRRGSSRDRRGSSRDRKRNTRDDRSKDSYDSRRRDFSPKSHKSRKIPPERKEEEVETYFEKQAAESAAKKKDKIKTPIMIIPPGKSKLPFIGRMPLLKRKPQNENEKKEEEEQEKNITSKNISRFAELELNLIQTAETKEQNSEEKDIHADMFYDPAYLTAPGGRPIKMDNWVTDTVEEADMDIDENEQEVAEPVAADEKKVVQREEELPKDFKDALNLLFPEPGAKREAPVEGQPAPPGELESTLTQSWPAYDANGYPTGYANYYPNYPGYEGYNNAYYPGYEQYSVPQPSAADAPLYPTETVKVQSEITKIPTPESEDHSGHDEDTDDDKTNKTKRRNPLSQRMRRHLAKKAAAEESAAHSLLEKPDEKSTREDLSDLAMLGIDEGDSIVG